MKVTNKWCQCIGKRLDYENSSSNFQHTLKHMPSRKKYVWYLIWCRLFWNVSLGDVNRSMPWYCGTIPSTKELKCVMSKYMGGIFAIEIQKYAFSCRFCIDVKGCALDGCENHGYVKQWKYVPLYNGATYNTDMERDAC